MTDNEKRELADIVRHHAEQDWSTMSPESIRMCVVPYTESIADFGSPETYVAASPYCRDMTGQQRQDVIAGLRRYLAEHSTSMERRRHQSMAMLAGQNIAERAAQLGPLTSAKRIPHGTVLDLISGLEWRLASLRRFVRDDQACPTDIDGIPWVSVECALGDRNQLAVDARCYAYSDADATTDADIVDARFYAYDEDGECEREMRESELSDTDQGWWQQSIRDWARECLIEHGLICGDCDQVTCTCERREVASA